MGNLIVKSIFVFSVVASMVLLVSTACGQKAAPVTEAKTISIASLLPLTGPAASAASEYYNGYVDYAKWINEIQGGIQAGGKKYQLDIQYWDTGYSVPRTLTLLKRAIDEKIPMVIFHSTGDAEALKPMLASAEIIGLTGSLSEAIVSPPGWVYGTTPGYPAGFGLAINWIKANWKESRVPNIGFCTWDSAYGRAILTDECLAYAEQNGCKIVGKEFFGAGPTDLMPQLQNLSKAGADFIFGNFTDPQTSLLLRQAYELGITPKTRIISSTHSFDLAVLQKLGGMSAKITEGWVGTFDTPWYSENTPGAKLMTDMRAKYRPGVTEQSIYYPKALTLLAFAKEILGRSIQAVGINNVTGSVVKLKGADTLVNWLDPDGMLPTISCSATDVVALKKLKVMEVRSGTPVTIKDWSDVPPLGWGKYQK